MPVRDGGGGLAELVQRFGFVQVRVGVVGVNVESDVERFDGGRQFSQTCVETAELRPGFEIIVVKRHHHVVPLQRSARIVETVEDFREMEVRGDVLRLIQKTESERFGGGGQFTGIGQAATFVEAFGGGPVVAAMRLEGEDARFDFR